MGGIPGGRIGRLGEEGPPGVTLGRTAPGLALPPPFELLDKDLPLSLGRARGLPLPK